MFAVSKYRISWKKIKPLLPLCRSIFTELEFDELNTPLVPLKNRKYLPGSALTEMPDYLSRKTHENLKIVKWKYPSVLSSVDKNSIGCDVRTFVDEFIKKYPAILIKGLPISTVECFKNLADDIGYNKMTYSSGSAFREKYFSNVYAASDERMEFSIEPHNEMSYLEHAPSKVSLFLLI